MDKDELANARAIPLSGVLEQLGAERDPKDPTRNWRVGSSRLTVSGSQFYDHNAAGAAHRMRGGKPGGGGAIDLVQYLKDVSFSDAVAKLKDLQNITPIAIEPARIADRSTPSAAPSPHASRLDRVRWYLTESRAIPSDIVEAAISTGSLFGDARGNAVFRLQDLTGAQVGFELRGTYDKPFHSVHGEKGLFIMKGDSSRTAAFVESGIEALSYRAVRNAGLVISTTGSAIELPGKMSHALHARGFEIIAAFNADLAGDRMSERLAGFAGVTIRRERPTHEAGKDWNDLLQARRVQESQKESPPDRDVHTVLSR